MASHPKIRSLVVVAALVIAMAACSSNGSNRASRPSSGSTATPASSPIKVGFICSCSGNPAVATNLPPEDVYKSWANSVNAAGGIEGHRLQVIADDDAGNPGTSIADVEAMIADHVVAIVDNSVVDSAWAADVQKAHVPVVGLISIGSTFITNPDFFPEAQTIDSTVYAIADLAKVAGAHTLGVLYCAEAPQCAELVPLLKTAGAKVGVKQVYAQAISSTALDYTAQCVAAREKHVSAMFLAGASTTNGRVATDCAQQGYHPVYLVEGDGYEASMAATPALKNSLWLESVGIPFFSNLPAVQAADAAVDKYYPGVRTSSAWSENAVLGWSSGLLLEDALKAGGLTAGGTPTAAEVLAGLYSLKGDTLDGMAPPLTFSRSRPHAVDCWFTGRITNGVAVVTGGGRTTCEAGTSS